MMSLRETLIEMKAFPQPDGSRLLVMQSVEHPDFPITNKAIRIYIFKANLARNVDGGCFITEYASMNMGGWFPMRLMNMMIGTNMKKGMEEMIKRIGKYQEEVDQGM